MLPIYGNCSGHKLKELQVLQNRCLKSILGVPSRTATSYLYSSSLLPIRILYDSQCMMTIFMVLNNNINHNFELMTNSHFHGRMTRRSDLIHLSDNYYFLNDMIAKYNESDDDIRCISNLRKFKMRTSFYLISVDEDFFPVSPYVVCNYV